MRISAERDEDRGFRVVRKSDGSEPQYVFEADTETGEYKRYIPGPDGYLIYDPVTDKGVSEVVREPFRIVARDTREVVAETKE